ncbi:nickel-binding protein, partial [Echinicola sediminis]
MDFHQLGTITIEEVKTVHFADPSIQEKYGVKYHQFWVNEKTGLVFCLMEGPDLATCELVHKLAYGNIACTITEVEPALYRTLLDQSPLSVKTAEATGQQIDLGYRYVLAISLCIGCPNDLSTIQEPNIPPYWSRKLIADNFHAFRGQSVNLPEDGSILAIFNKGTDAVNCALSIHKQLGKKRGRSPALISTIGLSASKFSSKEKPLMHAAMKLAQRLSNTCPNNHILVAHSVKKLCSELLELHLPFIKYANPCDERFISDIFTITEDHLSDNQFSIPNLCRFIGMSRPQLYRKITQISGRSPLCFLRDIRLEKARSLLIQKTGNIAEIANAVGYSNPSYFSRCFADKFGINPSLLNHGP